MFQQNNLSNQNLLVKHSDVNAQILVVNTFVLSPLILIETLFAKYCKFNGGSCASTKIAGHGDDLIAPIHILIFLLL